MKAKHRFWVIVFLDENGIEKSELVYSYHVLTVESATHFCNRPITRIFNHAGTANLDACDHVIPIFMDVHW